MMSLANVRGGAALEHTAGTASEESSLCAELILSLSMVGELPSGVSKRSKNCLGRRTQGCRGVGCNESSRDAGETGRRGGRTPVRMLPAANPVVQTNAGSKEK